MTRFSETDKWRDPWFRSLPPHDKLLFLFILDNCNNAGFWEEDMDYACYATGMNQGAYQGAIKGLVRGIQGANGWYWVRRFLKHQKNENLNPVNKAHGQIIRLLREQAVRFSKVEGFDDFLAPYKGLLKGLPSPTGIGISKGTGKSQDSEGGQKPSEPSRKMEGFSAFWEAYPKKKAKGDAEDAWAKMKCSPLLEMILSAISRSRKSKEWKDSDGKFIPHPATWLNRKGWEDDISDHPSKPQDPHVEIEVEDLMTPILERKRLEREAALRGELEEVFE